MKRLHWAATWLLSCFCVLSHAQGTWPQRPVRVIVPLAAGGSVDQIGRMTAARLTERLGQQFVVDNRPGAGTMIGSSIVARATPDGYTLLQMSPGYAASAALYSMPFDATKDIVPIGMLAEGAMFMAIHPSVKAGNVAELVAFARAHPGALRYGSGGVGTSTHLATELFRQLSKTEITHIPYKGIGPAIADLLNGQIHFYIAPGGGLLPHIQAGKLRLLAVTGQKRSAELPDIPTVSEAVPGYSATFWFGLGAPAGTPSAVIQLLNSELGRMLQVADIAARLKSLDLEPAHSSPEGFGRRIASDIAMWSKVVKAGNIKP